VGRLLLLGASASGSSACPCQLWCTAATSGSKLEKYAPVSKGTGSGTLVMGRGVQKSPFGGADAGGGAGALRIGLI